MLSKTTLVKFKGYDVDEDGYIYLDKKIAISHRFLSPLRTTAKLPGLCLLVVEEGIKFFIAKPPFKVVDSHGVLMELGPNPPKQALLSLKQEHTFKAPRRIVQPVLTLGHPTYLNPQEPAVRPSTGQETPIDKVTLDMDGSYQDWWEGMHQPPWEENKNTRVLKNGRNSGEVDCH